MTTPIPLWPGPAPGSEAASWQEATTRAEAGELLVRNVVAPTLTPFLPEPSLANGTAVIVAPGGAFQLLSWESEGVNVAQWLVRRGIAAFVLKYRLRDTGPTDADFATAVMELATRMMPDGKPRKVDVDSLAPDILPLAYADGRQAVRVVRDHADELGIHNNALGFLGFSAGAFVATDVSLADERACHPDFVAAIYGGAASRGVTATSPPLFSVVAADDALCLDWCLDTFKAWQAAGRPAELHVYDQGGHGFGAKKLGLPIDTWLDRLADWMQALGYLPSPAPTQAPLVVRR